MRKTNGPRNGIRMLGGLHVLAGAGLAILIAFGAVASGALADGIPFFFLVALAVPIVAGVVLGVAISRGRTWSWYAAGFGYLLLAATSVFIARALWKLAPDVQVPPQAMAAAPVMLALVMALAYVYLFVARRDFAVEGRAGAWALAAHVLVSAAVAVAIPWWFTSGVESDLAEHRADEIQRIGHAQAATDEEFALLLDRLANGRDVERISAAWALGRIGRPEGLPPLVVAARDDGDTNVRLNAIDSVSTMGGNGVEQLLVELLGDGSRDVRAAALRGLANADSTDSIAAVGEMLDDDDAEMRATAVDALGASGSPEAAALLAAAAADSEEDVRSRVAFALGKLGREESVPTLVAMLGDERWEVRANAVQSLGRIGGRPAQAAIGRMTDDPSSQVRDVARAALERLR